MKIIATLACRNNSRRLYGKPLQLLENVSVLEYMINRLRERPEIHDIVLAISEARGNEAFVELAERLNVKYVLGDDRDVLGRLIKACELAKGDTVYRTTTESPFSYLEGLPEAVKSHAETNADYTAHANLPDGVMFELVKLSALQQSHRDGENRHRSELCTLYINEHPELFKKNLLHIEEKWKRPSYRLTIDFPEDLILCRKIIRNFNGDSRAIPYKELVSFLDANPQLRSLVENITDDSYIKPYH
jgi:spore coat polysaccharide biosynthesis protein SpsF (cytidylyltransferase family)